MMMFTFNLPKGAERGPVVLVMVLDKENIARMKMADPFDLKFCHCPPAQGLNINRPLRDIDLVLAYEEDMPRVLEFHRSGDLSGLMGWLERGRTVYDGEVGSPRIVT